MKKHLIVLFSILFFTACEKEEPKPCSDFLGMSFDYNGKTFRSEGKNFCAGFQGFFNRNNSEMLIGFEDCYSKPNEIAGLAARIVNFTGIGKYSEDNLFVSTDFSGSNVSYTHIIKSSFYINYFIEPILQDAGYTDGYISGSFNLIVADTAFTDTIKITNGRFCLSY